MNAPIMSMSAREGRVERPVSVLRVVGFVVSAACARPVGRTSVRHRLSYPEASKRSPSTHNHTNTETEFGHARVATMSYYALFALELARRPFALLNQFSATQVQDA
jgi:hypothetical protein